MVYRVFVERRPDFDGEARALCADLRENLRIDGLSGVRIINRYDVEGISDEVMDRARVTVFSEPQSDLIGETLDVPESDAVIASEYLPGQFDQRADSCEQCIQLLTCGERPTVRCAKIWVLSGRLTPEELGKVSRYLINPVESREASLEKPETLAQNYERPADVAVIEGFTEMANSGAAAFAAKWNLAMDADDVLFCRDYFRSEHRDPTVTELRVIDTYWSDHCRHTTFLTSIDGVSVSDPAVRAAYDEYLSVREKVYAGRRPHPVTLMDLATIGAKYLKKTGVLKNLDESEEINACTVKIKIKVDSEDEDWLLLFKNETHNHPTEIEPFGGAATCLGGAIRDPLSGRAYVYQAMRVTGAADPRRPVSETLPGKLPQSKLTVGAANGYSSYGNQIGLATGGVYELYHPGYVAKRLEIGAVVGAAPAANVVREEPEPGDAVILLGGRTGRDGMGGATGSSKAHNLESLASCGAEVQKGNAPEERKLQRLFRDPAVTRMIRRCNDFGAGGVSVAIGELADGLDIDLDAVPKKYEGLDGTELAVSESQERMAVVVRRADIDRFIAAANRENLEATVVASVTDRERMTMRWRGKVVADLTRAFLASNGAPKHTTVDAADPGAASKDADLSSRLGLGGKPFDEACRTLMGDLSVCSQMGLSERFDSTIGAGSVVMPWGGAYQLTAPQFMAAKLPVTSGVTDDCTVMAYGFDPYLSSSSPFAGAACAVVDSVARVVASGARYEKCYLTFQEFFGRVREDPRRWGKPFEALLGALTAQLGLGVGAIGGKDSMSGSFEDLDVPPTLVSFAIAQSSAPKVITPEFKRAGDRVCYLAAKRRENGLPDYESLKEVFDAVSDAAESGRAMSVYAVGAGGITEAVIKMGFGNGFGFAFDGGFERSKLFARGCGDFLLEMAPGSADIGEYVGDVLDRTELTFGRDKVSTVDLLEAWKAPLEKVFPTTARGQKTATYPKLSCDIRPVGHCAAHFARPRVAIPVFPGTNCEYDTAKKFAQAGAEPSVYVLRNLSAASLDESLSELTAVIDASQILMLPGGFSGGDEPDGSGKFICAVLRSPRVREAVTKLLDERGGLILGICNGFQALVKSGLLPYGRILDRLSPDSPTLTYNSIHRHQSMMVSTRVASVRSPWMAGVEVGEIFTVPVSHGEGRFVAPQALLDELAAGGRIATQYVTPEGNPTSDIRYNPNNSALAVEGIFSEDGRIFGKMGHIERSGRDISRNVPGEKDMRVFEAGVKYFA